MSAQGPGLPRQATLDWTSAESRLTFHNEHGTLPEHMQIRMPSLPTPSSGSEFMTSRESLPPPAPAAKPKKRRFLSRRSESDSDSEDEGPAPAPAKAAAAAGDSKSPFSFSSETFFGISDSGPASPPRPGAGAGSQPASGAVPSGSAGSAAAAVAPAAAASPASVPIAIAPDSPVAVAAPAKSSLHSKIEILLQWRGVTLDVPEIKDKKTTYKTILHGISGQVAPGEMLAVMGPSGCGKTSLLGVLAKKTRIGVGGSIEINGEKATPEDIRAFSGFVAQDDQYFESLTAREILTYAAQLKIPDATSDKSRRVRERVEEIIAELDLTKCANTRVGQVGKGLSGGERRRLAIGIELLNNPSLILLDEPTSGLDSASALMVVSILKRLAVEQRRTVIATVHQPRASALAMFDKLLLMADGKTMYFGPTNSKVCMGFFRDAGYPCPKFENPADFMLDLINTKAGTPVNVALSTGEDVPDEHFDDEPEPQEDQQQGESKGEGSSGGGGVRSSRRKKRLAAAMAAADAASKAPAVARAPSGPSPHAPLALTVPLEKADFAPSAAAVSDLDSNFPAQGPGLPRVPSSLFRALSMSSAFAAPAPAPAPAAAAAAAADKPVFVHAFEESGENGSEIEMQEMNGDSEAEAEETDEGPRRRGGKSTKNKKSKQRALAPALMQIDRRQVVESLADSYRKSAIAERAMRAPAQIPPPLSELRQAGRGRGEAATKARDLIAVGVSWWTQFSVVLRRSFFHKMREPLAAVTQAFNAVFISFIIGSVYWRLNDSQDAVQSRLAALTLLVLMQSFMCYDILLLFPLERAVYLREQGSGLYVTSSFYLGRTLADMPLHILFASIAATLSYFLVGFQEDVLKFWTWVLILVMVTLAGASMLMFFGSLAKTMDQSNLLATFFLILFMMFGGNWIAENQIPRAYKWLSSISFMKYGYEAAVKSQFEGLALSCSEEEIARFGLGDRCPYANGDAVLVAQSLQNVNIGWNMGVLAIMIFVYRFMAYLGLRFMHTGQTFRERLWG